MLTVFVIQMTRGKKLNPTSPRRRMRERFRRRGGGNEVERFRDLFVSPKDEV